MNSLLEKEGFAGKVQMIYIDPPYGIKYGSNFQPFVNKRDVKDGNDEDLTAEPEQIRAFRDTWEVGIHSYLTYLRDRLLLARELLAESGSIFVQISDENVHHVRELMDEVFGAENFRRVVTIKKRSAQPDKFLSGTADYLIWFSKHRERAKYNQLYWLSDGECSGDEFVTSDLTSSHEYHRTPFEYQGQVFDPGSRYWSTSINGLANRRLTGEISPNESARAKLASRVGDGTQSCCRSRDRLPQYNRPLNCEVLPSRPVFCPQNPRLSPEKLATQRCTEGSAVLEEYRKHLVETGASPATVRGYLCDVGFFAG